MNTAHADRSNDDTIPLSRATRRRRARSIPLALFGVLCILAGAGLVADLLLYKETAKSDAASLRDELAQKVELANHGSTCTAPPPSAPTDGDEPRMLLSVPAIGVNAPVLEGTSDHVLNEGIGHVSDSTWPDQGGSDVLAAHNATFFVRLPDLKPGDLITLSAPCRQWTYKVSDQQVVPNTTGVPTSEESKLFLVTCWPIDALFNTADRYLLSADLVSANNDITDSGVRGPGAVPTWKATLPSGLAGTDLSNAATGVVTGRLATAGTPSAAWQSSPASLNAVGASVELFGAAVKTARAQHVAWWSTVAPGVPASALTPMMNAFDRITFKSPLDLTVTADGDSLTRVDMSTTAQVGSGTYRVNATASAHGSRLSLSAWKMTLTAGTAPAATPTPTPSPTEESPPSRPAKPTATATQTSVPPAMTPKPAPAPVRTATPPPPAATSTSATNSPSASKPDGDPSGAAARTSSAVSLPTP